MSHSEKTRNTEQSVRDKPKSNRRESGVSNHGSTARSLMEKPALRLLIQGKRVEGRLPNNHIPRIWGGPGHGEICAAATRS
jgi:hypothetical protein